MVKQNLSVEEWMFLSEVFWELAVEERVGIQVCGGQGVVLCSAQPLGIMGSVYCNNSLSCSVPADTPSILLLYDNAQKIGHKQLDGRLKDSITAMQLNNAKIKKQAIELD